MKRVQDKQKKHNQAQKKLKLILPAERYKHSLRSVAIAEKLAERYGVDADEARIAALLHDCSRFLSPPQMLKKALRLGLGAGPAERFEPKLLHAALSAYFAKKIFGIKNRRVLKAISSHTVGSTSMSLLDKIVYLADHIEEDRKYSGVKKVMSLAYKNIDQAVMESLSNTIRYLLKSGLPICGETIESRNALIKNYGRY